MIPPNYPVLLKQLETTDHGIPPEVWSKLLLVAYPGEYADRPLPPLSTDYLPGTEGKQRVISERIAAGYHPFHPKDVTIQGLAGVNRTNPNARNGKASGRIQFQGKN